MDIAPVLLALLILWVVITFLGHLSWVLIRGLFRLITGVAEPKIQPPLPTEQSDITAARRVLGRLLVRGLLDEPSAAELQKKIRNLEFQQSTSTIHPLSRPIEPTAEGMEHPEPASPWGSQSQPDVGPPAEEPVLASLVEEEAPTDFTPPITPPSKAATQPTPTPTATPPAPTPPVAMPPSQRATPFPVPSQGVEPILSRSQVIQSFLAAHNIRWGELVAGMLIVICSIGLVISLWSPLVETHRVIPSLIFLGANAAIYAAGLYTLSRWRLRHTSRAVLIIATLLVPLSVLAGMAAAGTSADAVQLNDPITLGAIAIAGAIYTLLVFLGGKALSRAWHSVSMALSVVGPVAVLPLVPAAVRTYGANAGWILLLGSGAILFAALRMIQFGKHAAAPLGTAGSRSRLMMMAFGGFALAVAIGYTAFSLRAFGTEAMLPIAIATIPAMIALAGTSRSLMISAINHTMSLTGAVVCTILIGLSWTILPVSMTAASWVWSWAVVLSASAIVVGWMFGQPRWLAFATLPPGIAATFSAPIWLGDESWEAIALWQRMIGGEPMLAAFAMAIVVGGLTSAIREPAARRWMGYAAIFWSVLAASIAAVLAVAPVSTLGVAPWWTVTIVLAGTVAVAVAMSMRHHAWSLVTIAGVVFAWLSVLRPIAWNESLGSAGAWMMTLLGIAGTMMLLRELLPQLAVMRGIDPQVSERSARFWEPTSIAASVTAAVIACLTAHRDWSDSAATLSVASGLLLWSSTASKSIDVLRISQLSTAALFVVIGYGRFSDQLFGSEAWSNGGAIWAWAITSATTALLWMLIRAAVGSDKLPAMLQGRFEHLASHGAQPRHMLDGGLAIAATALTCVGSAWAYASLLARAGGSDLVVFDPAFGLPVAAFALCALVAWAMWRFERVDFVSANLAAAVVVGLVVWGSSQLGHLITAEEITRLVVAASVAAAGCIALSLWKVPRLGESLLRAVNVYSLAVATSVIAMASAVLLLNGWLDPILANKYADAFPSITVAVWWLLGAAGLLWNAKQTGARVSAFASAALVPASAALLVPVFSLSHPAVWIQVAAIASLGWIMIGYVWFRGEDQATVRDAMDGSMRLAVLVGVTSAVLVTISIVLNIQSLHVVFGYAGFILSVLAIALWIFRPLSLSHRFGAASDESVTGSLPWPVGLSLLAGQIAWLAYVVGLVSGIHVIELVPGIWLIASVASLVADRSDKRIVHFVHIAFATVATACVAWIVTPRSEFVPWLALAALVVGGLQVALASLSPRVGKAELVGARLLGWFVVVAGGQILVTQVGTGMIAHQHWTMLVGWSALWIVAWRLLAPERKVDSDKRRNVAIGIPDMEFAAFLAIAAILETLLFTLSGRHTFQATVLGDPLLWVRVGAYVAVGLSSVTRAGRMFVWTPAIATLVASTALVAVQASIHFDATSNQRFVWAMLPSGFAIAFIAHWLPGIARQLSRFADRPAAVHLVRLVQSTWQVAVAIAGLGVLSSVAMIVGGAPAADARLAIAAIALAAWAVAEMAEACDGAKLRHAAVTIALVTIGLWASVDSGDTNHPVLTATMRWLVASVFTIPILVFALPKLLGETLSARWRDALRQGAIIAGAAAGVSLVSMLVIEATIRTETGIADISIPIVIFVAVVLGALSVMAGMIGILSGPGSAWQQQFKLTDQQRSVMIIAAQAIGGITWLHVFLCKTEWAFIGLRGYWPFIVMGLAFLSVGATEWARRRGDQVLSHTLSHTALYLPLIPVIGFWLSGNFSDLQWAFRGGKVRYDVLLAVGSVYYIGLAAMWKQTLPRVAAIVLGNAAWWVVLVQLPGWGFLSHPQAWLIPPAVCVLVIAHIYRERLEPAVASGIRYASTLVIYISSTADMLLQQIGTNISGPIILVLLALAGMAAGVVLRVRPFLYLGATFVFLGVTSMVWHAHRAFDAVWPWWVFGISTGICLLIGLMAIEKNKPKLREYAERLASWQG